MARKEITETVTRTVTVCDVCAAEVGTYELRRCGVCRREVCTVCGCRRYFGADLGQVHLSFIVCTGCDAAGAGPVRQLTAIVNRAAAESRPVLAAWRAAVGGTDP